MANAIRESEQLVKAYVDVWNNQQYSKISEVVSNSFVLYDPAAPEDDIPGPKREVHGPEGLEMFIRGVKASFPDFQVSISDLLSTDDLVMYEGKIMMTHEGELNGVPPTGRKVEIGTMSKYRLSDGIIQEHRVYFNQQEVYEQLGLTEE